MAPGPPSARNVRLRAMQAKGPAGAHGQVDARRASTAGLRSGQAEAADQQQQPPARGLAAAADGQTGRRADGQRRRNHQRRHDMGSQGRKTVRFARGATGTTTPWPAVQGTPATGRQDERPTGREDDRTTGRQDDRTTGPKPTVMHPTHHTADGCLDSTQVHAVDEDFLGLPLAGTLAVDETQTAEPSLGCPPPTGWPRARFWLSSGRRTCPVDVKPRHDFNLHTALRIGRPALGAMFAKGRALGLATRGVSDHGFIDPVGLRAPNNCVVTLCTPHDGHGRLMGTAHNSACNRAGPPPGRQGRCGRLYLLLRRRSSTRQQVRRQSHAGRILQCCRAAGGVVDHHHHRCAFGQAVSAIEHRAGHHQ